MSEDKQLKFCYGYNPEVKDYSNTSLLTINEDMYTSQSLDSQQFKYKYNEKTLLRELEEYIKSTYSKHYVGENNVQSLDLIFYAGHGIGFCAGDVLKYAARYGKKKGYNREDILKALHYALLLLYRHDIEIDKK